MERKLASIQKIVSVSPIEDADRIEIAQVLGWQCVVAKKDNFKAGDLIVYIEIDSIVPERNEFEFLRDRKFRVKTIKLRKQISQGLVMPLSILYGFTQDVSDGYFETLREEVKYTEGEDVTELLGIKKYDSQATEEEALNEIKHRSKVMQYLMGYKTFRKIYLALNSKNKGSWPQWITHTDEERIQTCAKLLTTNIDKNFSITEKLDGQSATYFLHKTWKWGFPVWQFGVCSRNIWLKTPDNSNYWKIAKKYNIEKQLRKMGREAVIQGEILNTNVQSNKYKVTEPDFYVFTIAFNGQRVPTYVMETNVLELGLKVVPIINHKFNFVDNFGNVSEVKDIVQKMVTLSTNKSRLADIQREGIVCRLNDNSNVSFKVINPEFLLKYNE